MRVTSPCCHSWNTGCDGHFRWARVGNSPRGGGGCTGPLVLCSLRISPWPGHSSDWRSRASSVSPPSERWLIQTPSSAAFFLGVMELTWERVPGGGREQDCPFWWRPLTHCWIRHVLHLHGKKAWQRSIFAAATEAWPWGFSWRWCFISCSCSGGHTPVFPHLFS